MTLEPQNLRWVFVGGMVVTFLLLFAAFTNDSASELTRRLSRFGPLGSMRKSPSDNRQYAVRKSDNSTIMLLNHIVRLLPNPDNLRRRIARTGKSLMLGEYLLINLVVTSAFFFIFNIMGWQKAIAMPLAFTLGFGLPHMVVGYMGGRRIKKFLTNFPEAIDTMRRGIRSGLPVTESIAAVGREMPDPIGIEFSRIADGVRMGQSLEASMWEIGKRVDAPEYRFLIIAMAIQKETGGNLAETLGNLSELIRRRRQLRLKIKAMSSEAIASGAIIGSLPFITLTILMVINPEYMLTMFHSGGGKLALCGGLLWMSIGWAVMGKMIHFDL